jgi:hypothetical protein
MADETNDRKSADSGPRWPIAVLERLKKSEFAQRAADFAKSEVDRFLGTSQLASSRMTTLRAQELSNNLSQMLANLLIECKDEQRKLKSGGIFGLGGRDLSAHDIDTAVAALTAIAFHFEHEMMDHMRRASRGGSVVARQFLPPETEGAPSQPSSPQTMLAAGIGGWGTVSSLALPPERLRLIAEQLRGLYDYAVKFATDIQEDIAGSHGASPSAHEKALNKAIMLTQRLDYVATQILQLLDPTIDAKTVLSGTAGVRALPPMEGNASRPQAERPPATSRPIFEVIDRPPRRNGETD